MSRGAGARAQRRWRQAGLFARILVPAGAALSLLSLVTGRAREIDHELHLLAPDAVASGESLPVRAHLYADLRRAEGARLIAAPLSAELRAGSRVLARAPLRRSHAGSMDGVLALPAGFAGRAELVAIARPDDAVVRASRVVDVVAPAAPPPPLPIDPRPLRPLQRFAPGPIRSTQPAQRPPVLAARVLGGACVPERTCTVLVHVGEPAASVRAIAARSLTPDARSAQPSAVTSGVVGLRAVTHGPEAELQIVAESAGVTVATRAFRLPVALGASALHEQPRLLAPAAAPRIGLQDDERGCIVDGFFERRWVRTGALSACRGEPIPFAALTPGLWRLQVRRDPFAVDSAAVASVYVQRAGERAPDVLARLAHAALDQDPEDALARAVRDRPEAYAAELAPTATYLLALLDAGLLALPEPASGYPRARAHLLVERERVRKLALFALALCGLTVGLLVAQRGLRAATQAGELMAEAGEEPERIGRQRLRMTLRVMATVSSLLLVFAAIAAYVIARGNAP